jgi:hypothetical protein
VQRSGTSPGASQHPGFTWHILIPSVICVLFIE